MELSPEMWLAIAGIAFGAISEIIGLNPKWQSNSVIQILMKMAGAVVGKKGQAGKGSTMAIMALFLCLVAGFGLFGCATTGDSDGTNVVQTANTVLSPAGASFAGMTFAMIAPAQAAPMAAACTVITTFATQDSLIAYLQDSLYDGYFDNMTENQAAIVQNFLGEIAGGIGINLDFDLSKVSVADDFDLSRAKEIIAAACVGIKAGLE